MESSQILYLHGHQPTQHLPIKIILSKLDPNDVENFQKSRNINPN